MTNLLQNHNEVQETGRNADLSESHLAITLAKVLNSGTYFDEHLSTRGNEIQLIKSLVPLEKAEIAFWAMLKKMNEQAQELEIASKKATGRAKDCAVKLNDSLKRVDQAINLPVLEKKIELLERAADAMERLNALQATGKLDKILAAIK